MGFDLLPNGNVVFADCRGIRLLTPTGVQPGYIAGHGGAVGYAGDGGPATNAVFSCPNDVIADVAGNLFIADIWNNRVRRIDGQTGIITTVAGKGPEGGNDAFGNGSFCGDDGPAVEACLNSPWAVVIHDAKLYIGDSSNNRIRKVDASGRITTAIAETGAATLAVDGAGNLYVSSRSNMVRVSPRGRRTFLAGQGLPAGFSGDGGPASQAQVDVQTGGWFTGFTIDAEGNLFFRVDDRIRAIRYGAVLAPPRATIEASSNGPTIRVTVREEDGGLATGVRVDFERPLSGATCALSSSFAITDANGVATVSCPPGCVAGTYAVTARPLISSSSATVTFTNRGGNCRRRAVRH